ncbi:MAG: hypothetical protein R2862_12790 [Thermoanaerobaculia bacterium]
MNPARPAPRSEYDPLFEAEPSPETVADDLAVERAFATASRPYLSSPWSWFAWAVILPLAALGTPWADRLTHGVGVAVLWTAAIVLGGSIEGLFLVRQRQRRQRSRWSAWAMRLQGNLSLVAVALSAVLLWIDAAELLPGLWLLLLGHSLFALGGLAFRPMRTAGILYQLGGVVALVPGSPALEAFAVATALGNLWIGIGVWKERVRREAGIVQPRAGSS